jgi:hypothetical protein
MLLHAGEFVFQKCITTGTYARAWSTSLNSTQKPYCHYYYQQFDIQLSSSQLQNLILHCLTGRFT